MKKISVFALTMVLLGCFALMFNLSSCEKVSDLAGRNPDGNQPSGNQPPDTIILSGPTGTISEFSATFAWTGSDDNDTPSQLTYSYKMDNAQWNGFSATTTKAFQNLGQGAHTFMVKARDSKGAVDPSPAIASFIVSNSGNSTAPDTQILEGPPASSTSDTAFFRWTGYDQQDPASALIYSYKLDNYSWSSFDFWTTITLTGLTNSSHVFQVKAKDTDGNEDPTPAQWSFTVNVSTKGVRLSVAATTLETSAGGFALFNCTITNIGDASDQFRVTLDNSSLPSGWIANLCKDGTCYADFKIDFTLGPGASDTFEPDVSPDYTAPSGSTGSFTVNAQSLTDPSVTDSLILTVRVL